ncbi:MAG: hypothetical protein IKN34_10475, partial [Treponema sp.]|nr:hypothetical protein [Treponema sp.]
GKPMDFRLTKLDAFSGASLLRLLAGLPALLIHDSGFLFLYLHHTLSSISGHRSPPPNRDVR